MTTLDTIKNLINACLSNLYEQDASLFERNNGKGICERALVFRFAYYLQTEINKVFPNKNYFVDCDFNSSIMRIKASNKITLQQRDGKPLRDSEGNLKKRFVDIIVHKRDNIEEDFICFEVKKWNNYRENNYEKDINNLKDLTSRFGYLYGFHLILGKTLSNVKYEVYKNGKLINH